MTRSEISKRAWRTRKREGGKATCFFCKKPIYSGGVTHQGKAWHKTCLEQMKFGLTRKQAGVANPFTKKIGNRDYTWINSYSTRLEAQREAARWLRDGCSAKIILSRIKNVMFPYQLFVDCTGRNPRRARDSYKFYGAGEINSSVEASEVLQAIDNNEGWYNRKAMMWRNLYLKHKRGTLDLSKAPKLFDYLTKSVSQYMEAEYGWVVSKLTRDEANKELVEEFTEKLEDNEFKEYPDMLKVRTPQVVYSPQARKYFNPVANPARPPSVWWTRMWSRAAAGYPRKASESLEKYKASIDRIVGGIWYKLPETTRAKLIRRYDKMAIPAKALTNPSKGKYYTVKAVPSGYKKSYPLKEVKSGTRVKLLEYAPKGSLDVVDVQLPDKTIASVYSFQLENPSSSICPSCGTPQTNPAKRFRCKCGAYLRRAKV